MRWFFMLCCHVTRLALLSYFRVEYRGTDRLPPQNDPYLLVSNHASNLDPLLITFPTRRWVRFLGKEELTEHRWFGWFFRALGIVGISRGAGDTSALDRCAGLVKEGFVLGIFPEGTRHPDGVLGRPKSGMALIAKQAAADVVPVAVAYERPLHFRSRAVVCYGEKIPFSALGLEEPSPRALKQATKLVWEKITALQEEIR